MSAATTRCIPAVRSSEGFELIPAVDNSHRGDTAGVVARDASGEVASGEVASHDVASVDVVGGTAAAVADSTYQHRSQE